MVLSEEANLARIQRIKAEAEASLLKLPGVTGVGVGYKEVGGHKTDVLAIRVYVERKHDVPAEQAVPKQIQGVPTDVIERRFLLHPGTKKTSRGGANQSIE